MKQSTDELSGILEIMNRLYLEIHGVEERFGLLFGNGDFRPRIDYFHDAIRALTKGGPEAYGPKGRLSVELLAYDLSALRYLQAMPLASLNSSGHAKPPGGIAPTPGSVVPHGAGDKPDRQVKIQLAELYQQYAVLFSALFKPHADNNYHERRDTLNDGVKQLSDILAFIESGANDQQVKDAVAHLDNPELRQLLFNLAEKKNKRDLVPMIKDAIREADKRIGALDAAHMQYGSAQLGLYEEGREIIKKLASRGMNLAGRFVEAAMAQARFELGR